MLPPPDESLTAGRSDPLTNVAYVRLAMFEGPQERVFTGAGSIHCSGGSPRSPGTSVERASLQADVNLTATIVDGDRSPMNHNRESTFIPAAPHRDEARGRSELRRRTVVKQHNRRFLHPHSHRNLKEPCRRFSYLPVGRVKNPRIQRTARFFMRQVAQAWLPLTLRLVCFDRASPSPGRRRVGKPTPVAAGGISSAQTPSLFWKRYWPDDRGHDRVTSTSGPIGIYPNHRTDHAVFKSRIIRLAA